MRFFWSFGGRSKSQIYLAPELSQNWLKIPKLTGGRFTISATGENHTEYFLQSKLLKENFFENWQDIKIEKYFPLVSYLNERIGSASNVLG